MELKPCPNPVCQCDRVTTWRAKGGKHLLRVRYFVECDNCYHKGPSKRFRRSAIKAWNRRVDNPRLGIADGKNSVDSTRKGVEEG